MRSFAIVLLIALLAGCASAPPMPSCRNPHPAPVDCSYDISALMATARFDHVYAADRAADAVRTMGYNVTIANERGVVGYSPEDERIDVEARDGWFWFTLSRPLADPMDELTADEVTAEGEARCGAGAGSQMQGAIDEFEHLTGWSHSTWEPCRASGGVS